MPWFQPQHQHLLSMDWLEKLLRRSGFEPLSWHLGEAHQPLDAMFAVGLFVGRFAPTVGRPWRAPPQVWDPAWNKVAWMAAIPALGTARLFDILLNPLVKRMGWSNTFRVVARASAGHG